MKSEGKENNKGSYIILGELKKDIHLKIGKLGNIFFKKGFYLYVGSAMNSLISRIKRHLRKNKKLRWHIDYIIPYFKNVKVLIINSKEKIECIISSEIEKICDGYIKGFGSSDCKCKSHLYFFRKNPFQNEKFINISLKYRMNRLKKFI